MLGRSARTTLILALAAMIGAAPVAGTAGEMGKEKFKPGDVAPDFTLRDLAGKEIKLSQYRGSSVVLLNFWGLRCGACLEEIPFLETIGKKYAAQGAVVLGVDTDGVGAQDVLDTLKELKLGITYPILVDPEFSVTDTYTNFLVPLTIVIDKKGVITYIHTGFEKGTEKHYEDAVKKALGA